MTTKQTILNELRRGPQTSYGLSNATDRPQPSVRRSIGMLRAAGWGIESTGTGLDAMYRLTGETPLSEYLARTLAVPQADGDDGTTTAFDTDIDAGDSL